MIFPCVGSPRLFDSSSGPEDEDVEAAKAICHRCPAMARCRIQGREGRESGVWGGESEPERTQAGYGPQVLVEDIPFCGTGAAINRHKLLGETCEVCLEADRARERRYDAKRRTKVKLSKRPHIGTAQGYKTHVKEGESSLSDVCGCRTANAEARAEERARGRKKKVQKTREMVAA